MAAKESLPTGGFAVFDRFRTPSAGIVDRSIGGKDLTTALSRLGADPGADEVLAHAADAAARTRPHGSQPIATLLVGVGSLPQWWKGDFDPDKHPRWPEKSPDSQGPAASPGCRQSRARPKRG
jgi:hypothetical protein